MWNWIQSVNSQSWNRSVLHTTKSQWSIASGVWALSKENYWLGKKTICAGSLLLSSRWSFCLILKALVLPTGPKQFKVMSHTSLTVVQKWSTVVSCMNTFVTVCWWSINLFTEKNKKVFVSKCYLWNGLSRWLDVSQCWTQ